MLLSLRLPVLGYLGTVIADQFVFSENSSATSARPRIAIIGSGISGASTAFFLNQKLGPSVDPEIKLFEQQGRSGGRIESLDTSTQVVEIGAETISEDDWCIKNAVQHVGLKNVSFAASRTWAVYNGERFISQGSTVEISWREKAMSFWRYGASPLRFECAVDRAATKFESFGHSNDYFVNVTAELGFDSKHLQSADKFLDEIGVSSKRYREDILEPFARARCGRNLSKLTGLEFLLSMRKSSRFAVSGGNNILIDRLLEASKAIVNTDKAVQLISRERKGHRLHFESTVPEDFDIVILALPLRGSGIRLGKDLSTALDHLWPYSTLHVTQFTVRKGYGQFPGYGRLPQSALSPAYFNSSDLPGAILTTSNYSNPFLSLESRASICRRESCGLNPDMPSWDLEDCDSCSWEYTYRIVSQEPVENSTVAALLGRLDEPISVTLDDLGVVGIYRKQWLQAVPIYQPNTLLRNIEIDDNLFYLSGVEQLFSSLEMGCRMARNLARLLDILLNSGPIQSIGES